MKTKTIIKPRAIDKVKMSAKVVEIVKEANENNVLATNEFIHTESKKYEELMTIWISTKIVTDLVKKGLLLKNKVGNRYNYTVGELKAKDIVTNKDKYISIIKKCHQIEENVLQLMQVENDGVKDLSDIVEELNNVVEKLN